MSAAILTPITLAAIYLGGWFWAVWLTVLVLGMAAEWVGLCGTKVRSMVGFQIPAWLLLAGIFEEGLLLRAYGPQAGFEFLILGALILPRGVGAQRVLGLGILYIGPAYLALLTMRSAPHGLRNLVFLAAVVWAGDIAAYLVGRFVGGPRLAPKISPGKTWSGAIGGALAAVLAGAAAGYERPVTAGLLALALSIVAQAGDLLESALKRHFGAKDSGWIIPGHGGLLDRLDGVLAAAPASLLWSFLHGPHNLFWQ